MLKFFTVNLDFFWFAALAQGNSLIRTFLSDSQEDILKESSLTAHSSESPSPVLRQLRKDLQVYARGERVDFSGYYLILGNYSAVAQRVWTQTRLIPYGQVRSYKWIAQEIGSRGFRAVGQIMGKNPFPIIVPCHRVIASDGGLGGFGAGLNLKTKLLELEGLTFSEGKVVRVSRS